jgi:four helix bundle protein
MSTVKSRKQTELSGGIIDVPIIHSLYHLYKVLHVLLLKFPKSQRYTLGSKIQVELLATAEAVITAATTSDHLKKLDYLNIASAKLDLIRLLVRLAKDCKCLDNETYLDLESQLHEIGKMLGGWIKSL